MKSKTINAVISKKVQAWLNSIEDKDLAKRVKHDVLVTGGCITSTLLNEEINDFDIYLKTKESLKAVAEYYCNKFNENNKDKANKIGKKLHAWVLDGEDVDAWKKGEKRLSSFAYDYADLPYSHLGKWTTEAEDDPLNMRFHLRVSSMLTNLTPDRIKVMVNSDGVAQDGDSKADEVEYSIEEYLNAVDDGDSLPAEATEKGKYKPVFLSTNAITLSDKIQIVCRFYGSPEEIHSNYDFVHVTNYWTFKTGVVLNKEALAAILNKELLYIGSKYPVCSVIRTRKFIRRGWQINAGQYVKMAFQISELDLTNINVLEDQLVGVDSIYFLNFIHAKKYKTMKDKDFILDRQYLTTVIDRIFG